MKKMMPILALARASLLPMALGLVAATPTTAATPVFDATNYSQNILQAARALEQVNNQISSLQNETSMLEKMARNLERIEFPELDRLKRAMQDIDRLMGKAEGISYEVNELDARFRNLFPGGAGAALSRDQRLAGARARFDQAMQGYRHSLEVQAGIVSGLAGDEQLLRELVEKSQGSVGSLQAQQATNQLIALSTKQQFHLEQLMAAEFRSQALERARKAQAEDEAKASTRRFLGEGSAYSPR